MANGNANNIKTDDAAAAPATTTTTAAAGAAATQETGAAGSEAVKQLRAENLNDLVADLWLNDYTNIRATGAAATATAPTTTTAAAAAATSNSNATTTSTFSFKHFLSSSSTITAPSSTVTSLDPACGTGNSSSNSCNNSCSNTNSSTTATTITTLPKSTGARPKVPQSASDLNGSSKMKRSPRFSSFDSQASLAEYAACGSNTSSMRLRPDLRLLHDADVHNDDVGVVDDDDYEHAGLAQMRNSRLYDERNDDDIFPSKLHASSSSSSRYVPRSYSSNDMPPSCPASSPRRRAALRPNRLVLSTAAAAAAPKMKLDLPLDTASSSASALPDFVQDHLTEAWCPQSDAAAQLSSPPNSPAEINCNSSAGAAAGGNNALLLPASGLPSNSSSSGNNNVSSMPAQLPAGSNEATACSTGKMLPDFLSDGPILHSSQRLADVAIGLPSNPMIDSPPQDSTDNNSSSLRQQNEQLQRDLQETRLELSVQSRSAHEFEQQLLALTDARRRETQAAATQTQNMQRLRRQVAQLEAELFALRGGGGGGSSDLGGGAAVLTPGSSHSTTSSNTSRPSRTHQLSRDLLRAADNAEQNLRQLLVGVDNLRQMAANLEQPTAPAATPRSPSSDPYTEFK
ncbi:mucin-19 [Drosophila grimshawi]|uniref:GH14767 n=1 Tax=Drosophila grimshawi TaxID=7222 RepID=B4J3Q4_DROGR|nr:mucin-19 [Drosophila grimshawi]EDV97285.1 GH14767 [Drosophila grimshawi]